MTAVNDILNYLVQTFLGLYCIAMLLRFLLQLVRADFYNPISQFLVKITNPVVIPLRRVVPGFGGYFCSAERADEWQAFIESRADSLPGYERDLAQATERIGLAPESGACLV